MFKVGKTGRILLPPAGIPATSFFKNSTLIILFLVYQFHFLLAGPAPGGNVNSKSISPISSQMSSTTALKINAYSSYNHYRLHQPLHRLLFNSWPISSYNIPSQGPSSSPADQLPVSKPRPQIPNTASHSFGEDTTIKLFLKEHNTVRSSYNAPELVWSSDLVIAAKRVTDTCTFKHTSNNPYGENIAAGQTSPHQVVSEWVNGPEEKSVYDPKDPRDSHFTQVVWDGSREVGCAVTSCTTLTGASLPQSPIQFWACEYNPPGNVDTWYLKNVHAAAGGAPL